LTFLLLFDSTFSNGSSSFKYNFIFA
jgi:hypothetical protein